MKHLRLTYLFLTLLLALMSASCKDDSLFVPVAEEESGSGVYVSVVVNTEGGNASRVGQPTPGEDGDRPQPGVDDENRVYDLNVFFFQGEVDSDGKRLGINSENAEIIGVECLYFAEKELQYLGKDGYDAVYSVTKEVSEETNLQIGQTYDVLVVANYGRDITLSETINSLADLRDITHHAMSEATDGHRFLMSSAGPETNSITIEAGNSEYTPSTVSVNVERVAARVDVCLEKNGEYVPVDYPNDKAKITGMTLVNVYNQESYIFKRVSVETNFSQIVYLGDENINSDGKAINYVVDPQTQEANKVSDNYDNYFTDLDLITYAHWSLPDETTTISSVDDAGIEYSFLGYVQENVMPVSSIKTEEEKQKYCTGIVFRIEYTNNTTWGQSTPIQSIFYKTYWIRHADDDNPDDTGIMEYGIVRNNIYQINVKSISGREKELDITVKTKDWLHKQGSITWS